jgi:hypothetical protein
MHAVFTDEAQLHGQESARAGAQDPTQRGRRAGDSNGSANGVVHCLEPVGPPGQERLTISPLD